ncbi:MAG: DUF721 domain-containing protein [Armatimonadetes bacterium]|nr:DUF721 domain-containing protein [Armatimonadota bacterium]
MKRLSDVLPGALASPELLKAARAQMVMRRWEEAVGPFLAAKCVPDRYDHGTLWVAAAGSAWAQELRMRRLQVTDVLNTMARENLFTDLRVGVRRPRQS